MIAVPVLRALRESDAESLFAIYSDADAMRFRSSKPMSSLGDALEMIAYQHLKTPHGITIRKAVEVEGRVVGTVMLRYFSDAKNTCEIGYSIGRNFWGKGLGTELVKGVLSLLRNEKAISKVVAQCHKNNKASIKILEKNKFSLEHLSAQNDILNYWKSLKG